MSKDEKWILKTYEAGSYFGLISLFKETKKEYSVVALTNCLVAVLTVKKFEELLKKHPIMDLKIRINGNLLYEKHLTNYFSFQNSINYGT